MALTLVLSLITALVAYGVTIGIRARRLSLPPGPRGLPLLGNALQVPAEHGWLTFTHWAKKYGEIMHLNILGSSFIILNSREAIADLLEKRGSLYSDRPLFPMAGELAGYARYYALTRYGPHQTEGRKLISAAIGHRAAEDLQTMQEMKVVQLLSRLLRTPLEFQEHIRWHVASLVLRITHGITVDSCDDPLVRQMEKVMADFSKMTVPGAYLVESLPSLMYIPEWFPGAGFQRLAREARDYATRTTNQLYESAKEHLARGTAVPSFIGNFVHSHPNATIEEEDVYKNVALAFYSGGADTTVAAIDNYLILMAQNVDVQRKAQAEVDSVTGGARLPQFSDRKDLPYLDAVLKEVYRVNPVAPLALPHRVQAEDQYAGYRIPAGSTVIGNTWAILHDPSLYPNPDKVMPERYLQSPEKSENLNPDPRAFAFGYGRRVCPGKILAEDSLFILAASLLAVFDISNALALDGSAVRYKGGSISHPAPFKCNITPRPTVLARELQVTTQL